MYVLVVTFTRAQLLTCLNTHSFIFFFFLLAPLQNMKQIPKWAHKSNLIPALERQFLAGPHRLDPDDIFPEVSTCDLEAIFDQKKKRYTKRTSSGNWNNDCVTVPERMVYKRAMGFSK